MDKRIFLTKIIAAQIVAFLISSGLNGTVFLKGTPIVRSDLKERIAYLPEVFTSAVHNSSQPAQESSSNPASLPTGTTYSTPIPSIPMITVTNSPIPTTFFPTAIPTRYIPPTTKPTQIISTNTPQLTTPPPAGSSATALEQQTVDLINAERAKLGLGALTINAQLTTAARRQATDMYDHSHYDHTGTDGSTFLTRIKDAGFTGTPYGEVIGWMHTTAASIVQGWMASPPHHDIIMNKDAHLIGVGWDGNCQAGEIAL